MSKNASNECWKRNAFKNRSSGTDNVIRRKRDSESFVRSRRGSRRGWLKK